MSVISVASTASAWRGYEYFEAGAVKQLEKTDGGLLIRKVSGSGKNIYDVAVDLAHPKRSSCTCPHAAGRRIVCKHMVAAYFTAFPLEAEQYIAELREAEDEQAEYEEQVIQCVLKMKKTELQETYCKYYLMVRSGSMRNLLRNMSMLHPHKTEHAG